MWCMSAMHSPTQESCRRPEWRCKHNKDLDHRQGACTAASAKQQLRVACMPNPHLQ